MTGCSASKTARSGFAGRTHRDGSRCKTMALAAGNSSAASCFTFSPQASSASATTASSPIATGHRSSPCAASSCKCRSPASPTKPGRITGTSTGTHRRVPEDMPRVSPRAHGHHRSLSARLNPAASHGHLMTLARLLASHFHHPARLRVRGSVAACRCIACSGHSFALPGTLPAPPAPHGSRANLSQPLSAAGWPLSQETVPRCNAHSRCAVDACGSVQYVFSPPARIRRCALSIGAAAPPG